MTKSPKGKGKRPTAKEQAKVPYPEVRDRFLASSETGDYAVWLAEVGRYVHNCWLAEERARVDGTPLDEEASKHLWDECSERELINLRTEAAQELVAYRSRKFILAGGAFVRRVTAPAIIKILRWIVEALFAGFIGGIGLIVLGLLLATVTPHIVKTLRGTMDDLLPSTTSPHEIKKTP